MMNKNEEQDYVVEVADVAQVQEKHIYVTEFAKHHVAAGMLSFGYSLFKQANVINNLDRLEEMHSTLLEGRRFDNLQAVGEVVLNSLLDYIKICICFENYFKVRLLFNDFVIHKVKKTGEPEIDKLFKKQKTQPVSRYEVFPKEEIFQLQYLEEKLQNTTLDFIQLLLPNYVKYYNVSADLIKYLNSINKQRNRLHLYYSAKLTVSKKEIDALREIIKIVNCDIAVYQNTLLAKLDNNSNSRLVPICNQTLSI